MSGLRQYLFSVICAATVCAVISGIKKEETHGKLLKLICGIFLTIQILRPIPGLYGRSFDDFLPEYTDEAAVYVQEGSAIARQAKEQVIINQVESYILSKASSLDPKLTVEVTLGSGAELLPETVTIHSSLTEEEKLYLQQVLEEELAIAKENQIWIGGE